MSEQSIVWYTWIYSMLTFIFGSLNISYIHYGYPIIPHIDKCIIPIFTVMGLITSSICTGIFSTKLYYMYKHYREE